MRTHAIRFPLSLDEASRGVTVERSHEEYARQLVRQVLLVGPGERVCRPDFGAGIGQMVFEPLNAAVAVWARTSVYEALTTWLPTVIEVIHVNVRVVESTLDVDVTYLIRRTGETRFLNEEVTP